MSIDNSVNDLTGVDPQKAVQSWNFQI